LYDITYQVKRQLLYPVAIPEVVKWFARFKTQMGDLVGITYNIVTDMDPSNDTA